MPTIYTFFLEEELRRDFSSNVVTFLWIILSITVFPCIIFKTQQQQRNTITPYLMSFWKSRCDLHLWNQNLFLFTYFSWALFILINKHKIEEYDTWVKVMDMSRWLLDSAGRNIMGRWRDLNSLDSQAVIENVLIKFCSGTQLKAKQKVRAEVYLDHKMAC